MTITLSQMAKFSNGKKKNGSAGVIPVYGGNGIFDYTDSANSENCVIIGRVGAYCGSVHYEESSCWISDNAIRCEAKPGNDIRYLYYLLKGLKLDHRQIGTSQPLLTQGILNAIEVDAVPSFEKQVCIAGFLRQLDEKITLNQKTNDYLAAMCDAVFSERFGGIGDNAVLSDVANITMGQSPSGKSYNEDGNGTVFYQGRGEFGWRFPTQRLFTTEPKRMAAEGDVLMSVRAPVGDLNVAYEDCCIGRGLAAIHSQYPSYCLYLMRSLGKKLDAYNGEGTVFGSINGKALNGLEIGLPDADAIKAFEAFAQPIDQQIRSNVAEERSLATLRDALLPKLMSGEIDVSQIVLPTQPNNHLCVG